MSRPPIHPGKILADELKEAGVSASELARQLKLEPSRLSRIISGKRNITADTVLRLAHWFETTGDFWINLQKAYEMRLAEQVAGEEIAALPVRSALPSVPPQPSPL